MKFYLRTHFDWWKIMKITFSQLFIIVFISGMSYAKNGTGQDVLDRKIDIAFKDSKLNIVLDELERKADVKFVYSKSIINTDYKISIDVSKEKLSSVLQQLLNPIGLSYTVINDRIVVNRMNAPIEHLHSAAKNISIGSTVVAKHIVSGTVTSSAGEPLIGVSVKLKGSSIGVTTDVNGKYTIQIDDGSGYLLFSYVGFLTREVAVNGRSTINVELREDNKALNEVVVVAYGTQKKESLTGAVSNISGEQLNTAVQSNMTNMLTGKLPGLRVVQRTSEPGTYNTNFDIRGFGSPLIIIDGVPRSDFNRYNPSDIESITILKDASAAVYGAKSANGVILITTKKGTPGKVDFNYSGTYGIARITDSPDNMSSYEWATITNEKDLNTQYKATETRNRSVTFNQQALEEFRNGTRPNTQWLDVGLKNSAPINKHDISASGGNEKVRYYTSFGYLNEEGLFQTGDLFYNRYNFRSNITGQISKNLEAQMLLGGFLDKRQQPGNTNSDDIIKGLWQNRPDLPVYANNNPAYLQNLDDASHPLAKSDADYAGYTINNNKSLQGTFGLNYKVPFLPGLKAGTLFSYDYKNKFDKNWRKKFNLYSYDAVNNQYLASTYNGPSRLNSNFSEQTVAQIQGSLNYEKTFLKDHNLKALAVFEQIQYNIGINDVNGARDFSIDAVDELYAGDNSTTQVVNSSTSSDLFPFATQSYAGRLNYDYQNKYLLEGSFSYMGSSRFAPGHRWGFFPAVSGGWRISEESFMKDNLSFVNSLKMRASWGILGDEGSINTQWIDGYNYPGSPRHLFGSRVLTGLGFRALPYENVSWFESRTLDLGLDGDFLKNKLHVEFDWFRRERSGLFENRTLAIPTTVGANQPQENLNSDLTRGIEVVIGHSNKLREFRYNISANASVARTKNLYLERAQSGSSLSDWKSNYSNRWNDVIFGFKTIGQFQNQEEINNAPIHDNEGNRTILPGDFRYEDFNKDGIIDDNDQQIIGRSGSSKNPNSGLNYINTPNVSFALNLNMQWKGFDANVLFQGANKFFVRYSEQLQAPLFFGRNGLTQFLDRWHREDPAKPNSAWIPGTYPSTRNHGELGNNYRLSTFWLKDASYLRLRSVELGYTIPSKLLANRGIKSMRVYTNGYNLFTWSKVDFIDPEHTPENVGMKYPITQNYNFGVNLTF